MNRRRFLAGLLAGFAVATALARTKLEIVREGEGLCVPVKDGPYGPYEPSDPRFFPSFRYVRVESRDGGVVFRSIPLEEIYRA